MRPALAFPILFATALMLGGCSLPLSDAELPSENRCTTDADCGAQGVCKLDEQLCVSPDAALPGLLVEVFAPSGAVEEGGTTSLIALDLEGRESGGFSVANDLITSPLVTVIGQLTVTDPTCTDLVAQDGFFPINLELRPAGTPAGLSLQTVTRTSNADEGELQVRVPVGRYDVSLRPDTGEITPNDGTMLSECALPPALFSNLEVASDDFLVRLGLNQPPEERTGTVKGIDVTGWTVDLVENGQGRVISTVATLGAGSGSGADRETPFTVRYWQEVVDQAQTSTFLRIRPPAEARDLGYPSVLNALSVGSNFDLTPLATATTIPVKANVFNGAEGVSARVYIQSERFLDGEMGETAFYKREAQTNADGALELPLFVGSYVFTAIPNDPSLAATEIKVELGENDLGGKTIELQTKTRLEGTVRTATGDQGFGLSVDLTSVGQAAPSYLVTQTKPRPVSTETASDVTDQAGRFGFDVAPGQYDLTVRPSGDSGLPWAVLSSLTVDPNTPPLELSLSHPIIMFGRVQTPSNNLLPGAVIRVWSRRTDAEGEPSDAVFQVGETTANGDGEYRLFLPASLGDALAQ